MLVGAAAATAVLLAAACSSGGGGGSNATLPRPSTSLTTTTRAPITTTSSPPTTGSRPELPTTTAQSTTTTGPPTTSSSTTTTSTTTTPSTTSTTSSITTSTTAASTTTTSSSTTTSTAPPTAAGTIPPGGQETTGSRSFPWGALIALGGLAVLLVALLVRQRARRQAWWRQVDGLVRDGRAMTDLGASGPTTVEPEQLVAHWTTLEQRSQSLLAGLTEAVGDAPDAEVRAALATTTTATEAYLSALQTERQLRVGPPAPTGEQLQFAGAETAQCLAEVRGAIESLEQLVRDHMPAPATGAPAA